MNMTKGI